MGKGTVSQVGFEDMYTGDIDDDFEYSLDSSSEGILSLEEVPSGILGPGTHWQNSKSKQNKSQKKSSKSQDSLEEFWDNHECNGTIESNGSLVVEDVVDLEEEDSHIRQKKSVLGSFLNLGIGGGAMNIALLLLLLVPSIGLRFVPGLTWIGSLAYVFFMVYVYLSFPAFIGWAFGFGLQYFGPLNGYPFKIGALSIFPWLQDWQLHVRVVAHDAAFGNPPGFPFENFLEVERLDFEGSIPLAHLKNLLFWRREKIPLKKVPDFERFMKITFNHVEVQKPMVNFQLFNGEFNISTFTRILANGEASAALGRGKPLPNQLHVRILRAKNLCPASVKKTADPYVVVRARRQEQKTKTQTNTLNPMFNEEMVLHVDDASVVLEVAVYDRDAPEGLQAHLIGHWAMTTKYLATDPSFCWHHTKDFEVFPIKKPKAGGGTGFRGWVPLATKKWKKMNLCGQIELELIWKHVPEEEIQNRCIPARRYTALEQLQQQSSEDALRFGDVARVRDWLNHEPFCYDVKRFTVRETRFYLQDLFRGHKGKGEQLILSNNSAHEADCIKLPFMEMKKQFRPKGDDEGVTTWDVFIGFFIGLLSHGAKSGKLGSAISQILGGSIFNVGYGLKHLALLNFDKAIVPLRAQNIKNVASLARSGFAVMHQNVTRNRRNKKQFKMAVEADDTDFLLDEAQVCGYLNRCAVRINEDITPEQMAKLVKRKGDFKQKYFELKGETLFYRKNKVLRKGQTYGLTYKICLDSVYQAVYVKSVNELLLNLIEDGHVVRLRDGLNTEDSDAKEVKIKKWIKVLLKHEVPYEEFE